MPPRALPAALPRVSSAWPRPASRAFPRPWCQPPPGRLVRLRRARRPPSPLPPMTRSSTSSALYVFLGESSPTLHLPDWTRGKLSPPCQYAIQLTIWQYGSKSGTKLEGADGIKSPNSSHTSSYEGSPVQMGNYHHTHNGTQHHSLQNGPGN